MSVTATLDGLIVSDPLFNSGRPVIAGTATSVRAIAALYKLGLTPEEITGELPLSLTQVYAALTYYHMHSEEVEADLEANSEEQLMAEYGDSINDPNSPLR